MALDDQLAPADWRNGAAADGTRGANGAPNADGRAVNDVASKLSLNSTDAHHDASPSQQLATDTFSSQPDHDFHSGWGVAYTNRPMAKDAYTHGLWQHYARDPRAVERQYHRLLHEYTRTFASFFRGYYPFSLHAHASDALSPTTIVSLVLNTAATSPLVLNSPTLAPKPHEAPDQTGQRVRRFAMDLLGWSDAHIAAPRFICTDDIYGAGYGPLAHSSHEWELQAIAAGPKPYVVSLADSPDALDAHFGKAKADGGVAFLMDLVSTNDGSVVAPERFALVQRLCAKHKLLLVLDETMTAVRCGAPFAFQRPEYKTPQSPDLVIFGKGLAASGIAMCFNGAITQHLAFDQVADIEQSLVYWRALVSRPIRLPNLIEALGILRTAQSEDWPSRSLVIGATIRAILAADLPPSLRQYDEIRGLGAVIAVHRRISLHYHVMAAIRRRSDWSRWLPKLDAPFADAQLLRQHVFGVESKTTRAKLASDAHAQSLMPLWCFICGIEACSKDWCRTCFLASCNNEVCEEGLLQHKCVGIEVA